MSVDIQLYIVKETKDCVFEFTNGDTTSKIVMDYQALSEFSSLVLSQKKHLLDLINKEDNEKTKDNCIEEAP